MLYIHFLCLTIETIFEWRYPSSFSTFRAFRYLHSFKSWRWVLLFRCLTSRRFTLKTFIKSDAFYGFATVNGKPSLVLPDNFFRFTPILCPSRFMEILVSHCGLVKFFASDRLILVASSFTNHLNTAIKFIRIQLIYSWLFYSVGIITKK